MARKETLMIAAGVAAGVAACYLLKRPPSKEKQTWEGKYHAGKDNMSKGVPETVSETVGGPVEAGSVEAGPVISPQIDTSEPSGRNVTPADISETKDTDRSPRNSSINEDRRKQDKAENKDHKGLMKAGSIAGLLLMGGGLVGGGVALGAEVSDDNGRENVAVTREVNDAQIGTILKLYDHAIDEVEQLNDGLDDVISRLDKINEKLDENLLPQASSSVVKPPATFSAKLNLEEARAYLDRLDGNKDGKLTVKISKKDGSGGVDTVDWALDRAAGFGNFNPANPIQNGAGRWRITSAAIADQGRTPADYRLVHDGDVIELKVGNGLAQAYIDSGLPLVNSNPGNSNPNGNNGSNGIGGGESSFVPESNSETTDPVVSEARGSVDIEEIGQNYRTIRVAPIVAPEGVPLLAADPIREREAESSSQNEKNDHKVNICHNTGSETHPVEAINVDEHAFDGEGENDHTQHGDFEYGGPVDKNGHPATEGDQWCEDQIVEPSPSPTSTPTPTPLECVKTDLKGRIFYDENRMVGDPVKVEVENVQPPEREACPDVLWLDVYGSPHTEPEGPGWLESQEFVKQFEITVKTGKEILEFEQVDADFCSYQWDLLRTSEEKKQPNFAGEEMIDYAFDKDEDCQVTLTPTATATPSPSPSPTPSPTPTQVPGGPTGLPGTGGPGGENRSLINPLTLLGSILGLGGAGIAYAASRAREEEKKRRYAHATVGNSNGLLDNDEENNVLPQDELNN